MCLAGIYWRLKYIFLCPIVLSPCDRWAFLVGDTPSSDRGATPPQRLHHIMLPSLRGGEEDWASVFNWSYVQSSRINLFVLRVFLESRICTNTPTSVK